MPIEDDDRLLDSEHRDRMLRGLRYRSASRQVLQLCLLRIRTLDERNAKNRKRVVRTRRHSTSVDRSLFASRQLEAQIAVDLGLAR